MVGVLFEADEEVLLLLELERFHIMDPARRHVAEIWDSERLSLFFLKSDKSLGTCEWCTYEEGVHELDRHLLSASMQPDLVYHSGAIIVNHAGAEQVEQDIW